MPRKFRYTQRSWAKPINPYCAVAPGRATGCGSSALSARLPLDAPLFAASQKSHRDAAMRACVRAWRRPRALLKEGRSLCGRANAVIDISDGVGSDARHIADASRVALVIDAQSLERAAGNRVHKVAEFLRHSALDWALTGGEDYALLATGKSHARPPFARCIGRVERGRGAWLETAEGRHLPVEAGYDHFK